MPDNVEKTIYQLELDSSGYIAGVESLVGSTKKLTTAQEAANKRLQENQDALKAQIDLVEKNRKALENYAGTDQKYKNQLERNLRSAQDGQTKLAELVDNVRKGYDAATTAAQNFATTSARANNLQAGTTGGKIPVSAPPGIQPTIVPQVSQIISKADLSGLPIIAAESKNQFEELRVAIALAEQKLQGLNKTSEEFKILAPIVTQGKDALEKYDNAAKAAGASSLTLSSSTLRLRTQILEGRDELVRMEQAGLGATQQYIDQEKHVSSLTQQYREAKNRINALSSETRAFDFGKSAVTLAISGFQTYNSIAILAGGSSEKLQKKTLELFAAMQLVASLEQLVVLTKRGSIIATNIQSVAQAVYTQVVIASTGALTAFRFALAATGIGAAIFAIGFLVAKYIQLRDAAEEAGKKQKDIDSILKESSKDYAKVIENVNELRINIGLAKDGFISKEGVVKQYNDTIGKTTGLVKTLDEAEQGLAKNAEAYIKFTLLKAAANIALGRAAEKAVNAEIQQREDEEELAKIKKGRGVTAGNQVEAETNREESERQKRLLAARKKRAQDDVGGLQEIASEFQKQAAEISKKFGFNFFEDTKITKDKKALENEFLKRKAELDAKLAEVNRKEADDESKIRVEYAARLTKELLDIEKARKEKKLTKPQAAILGTEATQINTLELDKALKDFKKKVTDARNKLNDELRSLQEKNTLDELNLIQDEFKRRAALIDFNQQRELDHSKKTTRDDLEKLEDEKALIGEKDYQNAKAKITADGEQASLNIILKYAEERKRLAADIFKQLLDAYKGAIEQADLVRDEGLAAAVKKLSDRYLAGKISFKKFSDEMDKLQQVDAKRRRDANLETEKSDLAAIDRELSTIEDKYSEYYKNLKAQSDKQRKIIAEGTIANAKADAEDKKKKDDHKASWDEIVASMAAVADSVIAFWQTTNDAEAKALDRSITLQETRVVAAQRIAARGNAEYLKNEEDRLTQLNVLRANNARKQMGIDAALQGSQILVAITGAISKIGTGNVAETIADIAVIIGALATGYALVRSLNANQPKFAEGTEYVNRNGRPSGIDTIPAMLSEGEAVTPADKNKAYHPTIKAIHGATIPPEHLNAFVNNYHRIKSVPMLNYERIKDAAGFHTAENGRMAVLLEENNELLRRANKTLHKMGVSVFLDQRGFAVTQMEVIDQMIKDKRS